MIKLMIIAIFSINVITHGMDDNLSRRYKIFHVALEIPMDDNTEPRKEFYVNMGSNQGIKPGVVLSVYRTVAIPDQFEGRVPRESYVKVGTLRVKSVEYDSSISELISLDKNRPVLDVDSIMLGDEVQIEFNDEHAL